ncbi:hypothetical protein INT43_007779 [Umbelopsis isabellina]|uniref:Mediator of RNA polymerase II transcription subunit 1 n=1 Tax=Mortierella isabellina TaxID=91625 RepID=A0A8H7PN97_MORIS|nr:hypothetical protein INT43_007779 [Umbelopsis isabellina]
MSNPTERKPNSNLASIAGLKSLLDDISAQWYLNTDADQRAGSASNVVGSTNLHPFGTVNIDKARQDFLKLTTAVRANCSQFESEVIGDVTKIGTGAEPAFRKHLMHLKVRYIQSREQANFESTVVRVKSNLQGTVRKLSSALSGSEANTFASIRTKSLQEIAEDLDLACYLDTSEKPGFDSPVTTITTAGNIIVIDVDIDDKGTVVKAKLTYATEMHQDDKVDRILLDNLKSDDLEGFQTNLKALSFVDKMNTKYSPIDFFNISKNLMEDFKTIYNQELLMASNNPGQVMNNGHGIPQMHVDHPGLSIFFWAGPVEMLETEWGQLEASIENAEIPATLKTATKMWISYEDSNTMTTYPPEAKSHFLLSFDETLESILAEENGEHFMIIDEPQQQDTGINIRYLKTSPNHPNASTVPVSFVANFDHPIPVSAYTCSQLANILGLPGINGLSGERDHSVDQQDDVGLEVLLVNECMHGTDNSKQSAVIQDLLTDNVRWRVEAENTIQNYVYMNSTAKRGKLLHRIPFGHPAQLYGIMQILRKQLVFNHIFHSVFNAKSMPKDGSDVVMNSEITLDDLLQDKEEGTIELELSIFEAPTSVQVTFMAPKTETNTFALVSFTITVPDSIPTAPVVTLQNPTSEDDQQLSWNSDIFDQQKLNTIIQSSYSIPLLVRWLWLKMKDAQEPLTVSSPKKKVAARSNSYFGTPEKTTKRSRTSLFPNSSPAPSKSMDLS